MSDLKWRHFQGDVILWAVRWYCRYGISYRDLEQMIGERGVPVDHSTIYRWVQPVHRQVKYLNNVVEADHGKLKQLIKPVRGFKTLKTAYATIKGFEVMRALRKGQAAIFNLTRDIRGEARIVERAFGIGPSVLAEAVEMLARNLLGQTA